jgi:tetratricopeptide (TPR) repeat protein
VLSVRYDEIGALELKGKAEPVPAWKAVGLLDAQAARRAPSRLIGKLCLPYALRGLLYWREGKWDEAERLFRRSHELAEQVGCSEVAFSALFGLAVALRDRGDANGSVTALDQALDVCERAGLIAQSIQATPPGR